MFVITESFMPKSWLFHGGKSQKTCLASANENIIVYPLKKQPVLAKTFKSLATYGHTHLMRNTRLSGDYTWTRGS